MEIKINGSINNIERKTRFKEIDIDLIGLYPQVSYFNVDSDNIEFHLYDIGGNLLLSNNNFKKYLVPNKYINDRQTSYIELDPVNDIESLGYISGDYKIEYNFFSNVSKDLFISDISTDRTELRLKFLSENNSDNILTIFNNDFTDYLLLNFVDNTQSVVVNVLKEENSILVKLYEPLPLDISVKDKTSIVKEIIYPYTFELNLDQIIGELEPPKLKGPNFDIDIKTKHNTPTKYYNNNELIASLSSDSQSKLINYINDKSYSLNVDYSDFINFVHFSSAEMRLNVLYNKVTQIENLNILKESIVDSDFKPNELSIIDNQISNIISDFDGFENFVYFNLDEKAWPKINNIKPYQLYSVTSIEVKNWFDSYIEQAQMYDMDNVDILIKTIPLYIRSNSDYDDYVTFINMIGHYFDNIWIYIESIKTIYNNDNNINRGISKDIIFDMLISMGFPVYNQENDSYDKFVNGDNLGSELFVNDMSVTSSYLNNIPKKDIQTEIYKRLYHNISLLLKTKGTKTNINSILTTYGVNDSILSLKEFGGSKSSYFKGYNNDNIHIIDNNIDSNVLSSFIDTEIKEETTDLLPEINLLDVSFSPQNIINERIQNYLDINGSISIDNMLGDPRDLYNDNYPNIITKQKEIQNSPALIDYSSFINLVKYFDNSMFKIMDEFKSAYHTLLSGITIKQTTLERTKFKPVLPLADNSILESELPPMVVSSDEDNNLKLYPGDKKEYYNGEIKAETYELKSRFDELNINPYATKYWILDKNNFDHSEFNVLNNNVFNSILSLKNKKIENIYDSNLNIVGTYVSDFQGSDDSFYSDKTSRYEGVKMFSKEYNTYNVGDYSYGKNSIIDRYVNKIGLFTQITNSPYLPNRNLVTLKYLVDINGNLTELNKRNKHWAEVQNTFISNDVLNVSLFDPKKYSNQTTTGGDKNIYESGYSYSPTLYIGTDTTLYFDKLNDSYSYYSTAINGLEPKYIKGGTTNNYPLVSSYVSNFFDQVVEGSDYMVGSSGTTPNTYTVPEIGNYKILSNVNLTVSSNSTFDSVWSLELYKNSVLIDSNEITASRNTGTGSCYYYRISTTNLDPSNIVSARYTTCNGVELDFPLYNDVVIIGGSKRLGEEIAREGSVYITNGEATITRLSFTGNYYYDVPETNTYGLEISVPTVSADVSDTFSIKLKRVSETVSNYTASLSEGSFTVSSLSQSSGNYPTLTEFFDTTNILSSTDEIIFSKKLTALSKGDYIFVPNPLGHATSSLYPVYGDIDYNLIPTQYDSIIMYLSDGSILESKILNTYIDSNGCLRLKLEKILSNLVKNDIKFHLYTRFLLLSRKEDENSIYLRFKKNEGETSYGFIIPHNINPSILENIDAITKEVKQKIIDIKI